MKTQSMNPKIRAEISIALRDLGADSTLLNEVESLPVDEMYSAAERLGGEPMLLAYIGSWGDTLSDEAVLEALQKWNRESIAARN